MTQRERNQTGVLGLSIALVMACAGTRQSGVVTAHGAQAAPRPVIQGGAFHVVGRPAGDGDAYDASMLFDRANEHARTQQWDKALGEYVRVVQEFPDNHLVPLAEYNRGLCLQRLNRLPEAAEALRAAAGSTDPDLSRTAQFRLAALGELAQQPTWVIEGTSALLARPRLEPPDRVEALARRAAALLAQGDRDGATHAAEDAVTAAPTADAVAALGDDTYAAQARFVLGEATRQQGAAVVYRVEAVDAEEAITRRVQLVTHAHVQFNDAIRVGNPHWAAASGFRIGEMYRDLYDGIVHAPTPADWDDHARAIYQRRTGERLRPLLQGALRAWESTLTMARRTGISDNDWVRRADQALEDLRALILGEGPRGPTGSHGPVEPRAPVPGTVRPAA